MASEAEQIKKRFLSLVELGGEMTHLDFKREFFPPESEEQARIRASNKIVEDVMAMYNAPLNAGQPFDSITGEKQQCSFLIFGVQYTKSSAKSKAWPLSRAPTLDETELQLIMRDRLNFEVSVELYPVDLSAADISAENMSKLGWLVDRNEPKKLNRYYLLQIRQNYASGPVFVTKKISSSKTKLKGLKNNLYGQLMARTQATNHTISAQNFAQNKKLVQDVFAKFDPGYRENKYLGRLEAISNSRSKGGAFRVLIINEMVDPKMESICSAWASTKWNLILDLDGHSAASGPRSLMKDAMVLDTTLANYMDLTSKDVVRTLELKHVQKTAACLHVLMSGDSTIPVKRPPVFPSSDLSSVMRDLFLRKETDSPLEVYVVVNSHIDLDAVSQSVRCILLAWRETCLTQDSSYFAMFTHKRLHEVVASYLGEDLKDESTDWIEAVAPLEQMETLFIQMKVAHVPSVAEEIVIESSGYEESGCLVSKMELQKIQKQFILYHKYMGSEIEKQTDDLDAFVSNSIDDYLQGFEATPNLFYIHENKTPAYVKRKLRDQILRKLRKKLYSCEPTRVAAQKFDDHPVKQNQKDLKDIVLLCHEPSAGGTTMGRSILWELRQEFPCLEMQPWSKDSLPDVEDAIRLVYFKARAPICILIDTSTVGGHTRVSDVEELTRQLKSITQNDDCVEVVILFVQSVNIKRSTDDSNQLLLTTKLIDAEPKEFDILYKKAVVIMKQTKLKTVALYGLCQFGHNYKRLEHDLDEIKNSAPLLDRSMLLLCSVTRVYSKLVFPLTLASKLLGFESGCKDAERILNCLGLARNLLLVKCSDVEENRTNGLHPPTTFVAEKIIEVVFGKIGALHQFVDTILELIDESAPVENAVEFLLTTIFIQRNVTFGDGVLGKKERFSEFVQHLETYSTSENKQKDTAEKLKKMVDCLGQTMPHFRAMFARYLAYNVKDIDAALLQMKQGVRVPPNAPFSSTNCKDTILLTITGHLLSIKLNRLTKTAEFPDAIESAQQLMQDAIDILERAQTAQTNVHPFVIESRLRFNYINMYYRKIFDGNRQALSEALSNHHDVFLVQSLGRIWQKLGDLSYLLHVRQLDGFDAETTTAAIGEIKVQVLRILVDLEGQPVESMIHEAKGDVHVGRCYVSYLLQTPRRWGALEQSSQISDVYEDAYEDNDRRPKTLDDLSLPQLKQVVDILSEHLSAGLEREDFRHAILAQIYIHQKSVGPRLEMTEGNASLCIQFAEQWTIAFPSDYRGWYYLAVLHLSIACVQKESSQPGQFQKSHLDQFWNAYTKCLNITRPPNASNSTGRSSWRELNFVITKKTQPLKVIRPRDKKYVFHDLWTERIFLIFQGQIKNSVSLGSLFVMLYPQISSGIPLSLFL